MSSILYSLSRIWVRDEGSGTPESEASSQIVTSTSGTEHLGSKTNILGAVGKRQPRSHLETSTNETTTGVSDTSVISSSRGRRSSRTSLNPCTTSASSPSCVISGYPKSALSKTSATGEPLKFPFVGHNRCQKSRSKRIMWEDSGYESISQRTGSHNSVSTEKVQTSPGSECGNSSNCYDDKLLDVNANTSKSRNNFEDICYGEKFQATPPRHATYIPPSLLNYRYQARRPQRPRTRTTIDQDKFIGGINDMSLGEMSPIYTSTPIKSATKPDFEGTRVSDDGSSLPAELFSFCSPSQQQLACSDGTNVSFSSTSLTKEMVDESVSKIVEEGSEEFRGKYSQWIAQVFHFQLDKMQRRLMNQFSKNLESVIREKEREIIGLQQKYRNKLIEYEASTEKFQKWIETLADENQRVRDTKDAIIAEMQQTAADQKNNFKIELEKQLNNVQAECEKEKLQLQRKHADQLKNINEKSMGQVTRLEDHFGKQVESLQALIGELKSQNVTMEEQLTFFKKSSDEQHSVLHNKYVNYHKEREQMLSLINDLREKLSHSEKEKSTIVATHNEEIFNIQKDSERVNQNISIRMANSQSIVESLQRKHEEDVLHLKKQLKFKESEYKQGIDDLRNKYGQRISHLTKTVEGLQHELLGGRSRTSNLV